MELRSCTLIGILVLFVLAVCNGNKIADRLARLSGTPRPTKDTGTRQTERPFRTQTRDKGTKAFTEATTATSPKSPFGDEPKWKKEPDERLSFEIDQHRSCHEGKRTRYEKIRFPDMSNATLIEETGRPGCYKLNGTVEVYDDLTDDLEMYVEYRHKFGDSPPEPCYEPEENGCGGYGGSCVQCDGCEHAKKHEKTLELAEVKLLKNGKKPKCGDVLRRGTHDDVTLSFCMPSKQQYLQAQGYDDETWQRIMEATAQYKGQTSLPLYMKVYIFGFKVSKMLAVQRGIEAKERKEREIPFNEPLPMKVYENLPFSRFITKTQLYVGCHLLSGSVSVTKNE